MTARKVGAGFVYVSGWADFQHPDALRSSHMPWLKLHTDLLGNQAWLELSGDDRTLLQTIWMLTARYGYGRVSADQRWLMSQAKLAYGPRSRNLERLNHAGFIRVLASKRASKPASKVACLDVDVDKERETRANGASNGTVTRRQQRHLANAIQSAKALTAGDPDHLVEDTIRKGYPDDLVPHILAAVLKP